MGLFSRSTPSGSTPPVKRRIPRLAPDFYEDIHRRLVANGGSDSVPDLAFGTANAVKNTAHQLFERTDDSRAAKRFDAEVGQYVSGDLAAADRMIDWIVGYAPVFEEPIETLIGRLNDLLSRPAT